MHIFPEGCKVPSPIIAQVGKCNCLFLLPRVPEDIGPKQRKLGTLWSYS